MVGKTPKVVPAEQTVVLKSLVHVSDAHSEKFAIVEQPLQSSLSNSLLVPASLVSLPNQRPWHLPVMFKNETEHDIVILPKTVLADVNAVV